METAPSLKPAEHFERAARAEFESERSKIARLLPEADVRHIGGTSVPGALTKGDLDIQVRVSPERFAPAVSRLRQIYATVNEDVWDAEFAVFAARPGPLPEPTRISIAAVGSLYDRNGAGLWDLVAAHPPLLRRYNDLKKKHVAEGRQAYEDAKAAFFKGLGHAELPGQGRARFTSSLEPQWNGRAAPTRPTSDASPDPRQRPW